MSDRLDLILELTRRLSAMVEQEIALIQNREPGRLAAHEDERTRLSTLYAREMQALKSDPIDRKAAMPRIERLKDETASLNASLERHQRLIKRMRRVTEGVVRAISDEAQRQRSPRTTYGAQGTATAAYTAKAAPIAINRKV